MIASHININYSNLKGGLTYLNMNEKAKDQTSHVLENPPPYPLFVQPPSIPPTARAILFATVVLNVTIKAIKQIRAPPNVNAKGGTLFISPVVDCRRFEAEILNDTFAFVLVVLF